MGPTDDFLASGMASEVVQRLWDLPDALKLFDHLGNITEPLRLPDLTAYIGALVLPEPQLFMTCPPKIWSTSAPYGSCC